MESEDTSVAKKGRKSCFREDWPVKFDWLMSQRDEFHELQILQSITATWGAPLNFVIVLLKFSVRGHCAPSKKSLSEALYIHKIKRKFLLFSSF